MGNDLYAADGTAPGMAGFLRLARPGNCVMSAVGVGIGGLVAVGAGAWGEFAWRLLWAGAAAAAFTAGGNALNDLYDRETDRVNHPERPLPAGEVTVASAKSFVVSAFTIATSLALLASPWAFVVVLVNIALMVSYEAVLKARGAPGNLVIAYLVGSLFLFAGVSVFRSAVEPLVRTGILASLAFFTTLGREITRTSRTCTAMWTAAPFPTGSVRGARVSSRGSPYCSASP